MKILAIGAHPDDIEVGCGGTLLKYSKARHEIYVYFITRGEAGGASAEQREKEARESARKIAVQNIWFADFKDTRLSPSGVLVDEIEKVIREVNPDIIFTHTSNDEHHDHRAVALCTIEAARNYPKLLSYEIPLTKYFIPQLFVDISDVIQEKVNLIATYGSQMKKRYLIKDAIYGLAQYRALQSRIHATKFVEAFQVVKFVWDLE
jgi:LmbE family N-acetylglucosaminyl deacetylase